MEGFKADENWVNHFDPRSPTDDQVASLNIASLDHSIFSDRTTLADTTHSQNYANSSIDEIMTASQNAYSSPIIDQDMSYNLGTESRLALQSYSFVEEESNGELKKEVEELKNMLCEIKMELITVKGQCQMTNSELYTVKSNHAQLLRWTLDMNETIKALLKWLAENVGANIVGQEAFHMEDLDSWLNPGSGS